MLDIAFIALGIIIGIIIGVFMIVRGFLKFFEVK